jgi:geranylgeranyl pyrophosphate synthase
MMVDWIEKLVFGQPLQEDIMEIYQSVLDLMCELPELKSWPEMDELVRRAVARMAQDWQLPVAACQAVGGDPARALPAVAAMACAQCSIILIDDMLDQDPRGEYHHLGEAAAANLAAALQAAGLKVLQNNPAISTVQVEILTSFNQMMLTTAQGQYMDIQNPGDETAYWKLVRTKSSPFFSTAFYLGALLGGAGSQTAEQLGYLGELYGEMIQIHDDLGDTMAVPAGPDWLQGRSPLPILFALVVDHPERERFLQLRQQAADPEALSEAQTILVRCGAFSYCIDQILERGQKASEMIAALALPGQARLQALFDELVKPVCDLFRSLEINQPIQ